MTFTCLETGPAVQCVRTWAADCFLPQGNLASVWSPQRAVPLIWTELFVIAAYLAGTSPPSLILSVCSANKDILLKWEFRPWLPHLLAQRTVPCFQQEILFPRRNTLPPVNRNCITFMHNKMSVFENVIFVRSSAKCFTHIWQTLNDLSSPVLSRPALRRLFYLQLPSSRDSCPSLDALENHQGIQRIAVWFAVYDLAVLPRASAAFVFIIPWAEWAASSPGSSGGLGVQVRGQIILFLLKLRFLFNKSQDRDASLTVSLRTKLA